MNTVRFGFSKPKQWKPFAWLIMTGYGIPYDHVFIQFHSSKYDRDMIYQASRSMVNFMGSTVFSKENIIVDSFDIELSDENFYRMMQFAIDNAGKAYGIKCAIGMAIVRIAEIFGKYIKNPFKYDGDTYVCSELAAYILQNFAGGAITKDLEDITPLDVFNYFNEVKSKL